MLIKWYLEHDYSTVVQWDLSQCICCRDGGLGWALEVRQVLSCGASVLVRHPMMLSGIDLWSEGWVGEVFLGLFWLEVGGVEGFCFYSAS